MFFFASTNRFLAGVVVCFMALIRRSSWSFAGRDSGARRYLLPRPRYHVALYIVHCELNNESIKRSCRPPGRDAFRLKKGGRAPKKIKILESERAARIEATLAEMGDAACHNNDTLYRSLSRMGPPTMSSLFGRVIGASWAHYNSIFSRNEAL